MAQKGAQIDNGPDEFFMVVGGITIASGYLEYALELSIKRAAGCGCHFQVRGIEGFEESFWPYRRLQNRMMGKQNRTTPLDAVILEVLVRMGSGG